MEIVAHIVSLVTSVSPQKYNKIFIFSYSQRHSLALLIVFFYCDEQEFNYILEEINCKTMTHWVVKIQNIINNDASKKKMIDCQSYLDFTLGTTHVLLILYDCMR